MIHKIFHRIKSNQKNYPKWNKIKNGVLKDIELFINSDMPSYNKMLSGDYDNFLWDYIKNNIKIEGKIVFDIGSHIGYDSFYFSKLVGGKGKVFSFEANHFNIARMEYILEKNPLAFKNIIINNVAISDKSGEVVFCFSENIDNQYSCGGHISGSITPLSGDVYKKIGFIEHRVKSVTIDDFVSNSQIEDIGIIKIDVEGAENSVLLGAKAIIERFKPIFLIEIHSIKAMFDVYEFFYKMNYIVDFIFQEENGIGYIAAKSK